MAWYTPQASIENVELYASDVSLNTDQIESDLRVMHAQLASVTAHVSDINLNTDKVESDLLLVNAQASLVRVAVSDSQILHDDIHKKERPTSFVRMPRVTTTISDRYSDAVPSGATYLLFRLRKNDAFVTFDTATPASDGIAWPVNAVWKQDVPTAATKCYYKNDGNKSDFTMDRAYAVHA
ncbi:MAG TPA: hypothetical protein VNA25_13560 [Phycisphaerae bacterium]|nr:hypothetical protein [Phycisphaerae bacterium]